MPLTPEDVARLEAATGRPASAFTVAVKGEVRLANVPWHDTQACTFLTAAGRCGVYENRPVGCRFYPLVMDMDLDKPVLHDDCPYHTEFEDRFVDAERLRRTVARIDALAAERTSREP